MIKKILFSFFLVELFIAVGISLYWDANSVSPHIVKIGPSFLGFLRSCSMELESFKIAIPEIPKIPSISYLEMEDVSWWNAVLNFFIQFANGFFTFINALTTILNFVVMVLNTLIQLIQFIFIVLKNFLFMKDSLARQSA